MLDTYFFIPANRNDFICKAEKINADFIVFDLEESIKVDDVKLSIKNLEQLKIRKDYWIRIPSLNFLHFGDLINLGFENFIIPKIKYESEFETIIKEFKNLEKFKFILLVENPYLLINLLKFVEKYKSYLEGIGLGSHDYASELNMQHDFENLTFARNLILNIARAFNLKAIDFTSLSIDDTEDLTNEFKSSVRLGFDGKFFIHPKQLEVFAKTKFYNDAEVLEAKVVLEMVKENKNYPVLKYNGKVYERPHIERLKKIKGWSDRYEKF